MSDDESLKRDEASVLRNFWRKLGGIVDRVVRVEQERDGTSRAEAA